MTMPSLLPACFQATPEDNKMWPPQVPISSHRLRIGRVLVAGFDRRLLALRQVRARRLRLVGAHLYLSRPRAEFASGQIHLGAHFQYIKYFPRPTPLGKAPFFIPFLIVKM